MIIEINKLTKTYEGKVPLEVLKEISFNVKKGEFVAIMGRSGCGKSTLLHQLSLLDTPTSGEIIINNQDVAKLSEEKKSKFRLKYLGYVFQEYALLPEFTALETICMPLSLLYVKENECKKRALEVLNEVGLKDRANHYPSELSGGQQQRVAIARAIVNKPMILFADEPCANLDNHSSKIILDLFKKLNKELNQTIIMVTHEPEDVRYVNRVINIKEGKISL